jgi:hypothetical protein
MNFWLPRTTQGTNRGVGFPFRCISLAHPFRQEGGWGDVETCLAGQASGPHELRAGEFE